MGFLDKVKNMFIEEVEEDEPIKKEVIQVKIPAPKVEEEPVLEEEVVVEQKREEKFVFPVYFDDKDFEKIEKKEEPKVEVAPVIVPPKREAYGIRKEEPKVEKKLFQPTPIISPVYGVLDKNYHKDEITSKKKVSIVKYQSNDNVDIDDVRKKAYGTLEDDLESNLFEKTSILFNDETEQDNMEEEGFIDIFDEPRHEQKDDFDLEDSISNDFEDELPIDDYEETDNMIEEQLNKTYPQEDKSYVDELNDSDLFNLIDSMYEKKEDE